jgi:hypothetical protein
LKPLLISLENTVFLAAEYGGMTIMCQDNIRGCRSLWFRAEEVEVNVKCKNLGNFACQT